MIYFLTLFAVMNLCDLHPIHISVSEVELNKDKLNWSVRIYKDDLLYALYGKVKDASVLDDHEKVSKDITAYIARSIIIEENNKLLKWTLVDIQPDPEAIWITVSTEVLSTENIELVIRNKVLLEVYNDQKNVVHITSGDNTKNIIFEKGNDKKVISF